MLRWFLCSEWSSGIFWRNWELVVVEVRGFFSWLQEGPRLLSMRPIYLDVGTASLKLVMNCACMLEDTVHVRQPDLRHVGD